MIRSDHHLDLVRFMGQFDRDRKDGCVGSQPAVHCSVSKPPLTLMALFFLRLVVRLA